MKIFLLKEMLENPKNKLLQSLSVKPENLKKEKNNMFEILINLFKDEAAAMKAHGVFNIVSSLVASIEQNVEKDGISKNAAIDTVIQLLQAHKTTPTQ